MIEPLVPRTAMPQVDEKDLGKLIVFMAKAGYRVLDAGNLLEQYYLHQSVDFQKAEAMPDFLLDKPILVTRLNEIIDGNHRAAKHTINGTAPPFIKFDCTFVEALNALAVFPFAYELTPLTPERN